MGIMQTQMDTFSSSGTGALTLVISIGFVLLISIAVVYFVIKHFRITTHT